MDGRLETGTHAGPDTYFGIDSLDETLATVLSSWPNAIVAALAEDGMLTAVPDDELFAGRQLVPVPSSPAGMLALVLPSDRMVAVDSWDRCLRTGIASGVARLQATPDRPIRLFLIDQRHRFGVRLCLMDHDAGKEGEIGPDDFLVGSPDALRPRHAAMSKNVYANIVDIDPDMSRMLGFAPAEMIGERSLTFLHPDDHEAAIANWLDLAARRQPTRIRVRHLMKGGAWLWVEVEHSFQDAENLGDIAILAQLNDISDEMAAHDAALQQEKLLRRVTEALPVGLFLVHTDGSVGYANDRLAGILGVPAGPDLTRQLATVSPGDRPELNAAFERVLHRAQDQELEVAVRLPSRLMPVPGGMEPVPGGAVPMPGTVAAVEERLCRFTLTALSDDEGHPGAIVTVDDVTESARLREELRIRASFDALTGCRNRATTMSALEDSLATGDHRLAVVFIDLDGFKPVNDELGHAAGDQLLQHAAAALTGLLRGGDVVGRIGGDEFLLICHGISTPAEALAVGARVSAALRHRVPLGNGVVTLQGSVGIALAGPGLSADALVALADTAMYSSKRLGDGSAVLSSATASPHTA